MLDALTPSERDDLAAELALGLLEGEERAQALRLKIEEDAAAPRLIRNEPAIGYRLADQD